ncbi:hypothetical protein [Streptomyces sp. NPDC101165]|uniref:hypothetical protein n=1 Tax=Streptomyces sp. NPDC101165 TaxID=3366119 RepID=UPI00381A81EA
MSRQREGTTSSGENNEDDEHDSTPARGKVGIDVDLRALTVQVGDETHENRFAAVHGTTYDGRTYTVYASASPADEQATLDQATRAILIGLPCLLAVVAGVTWLVTRRALKPVEGIRAEMAEITGIGDPLDEPASAGQAAPRLCSTR